MRLRRSLLGLLFVLAAPVLASAASPRQLKRTYRPQGGSTMRTSHNFAAMSQQHYKEYSKAVVQLLEKYPADQHVFIGVGRALTTLVGIMQNLDEHLAFNFPASGLSGSRGVDPAPYRQEYYRHFAKLIPASVLDGNHTIVLMDRSQGRGNGGSSIERVRKLLQDYIVSRGSPAKVIGVGLSEGAPAHGLAWMDVRSLPSVMGLNNDTLERQFGEYPEHHIGVRNTLEHLQRRQEYDHLKIVLGEHMQDDQALDAALHKLPGIQLVPAP